MAKAITKSCGPQLSPDDSLPRSDWPLEALNRYIQVENLTIQESEAALAAKYWRLGCGLTLVRRQFQRGQWQPYLQQQSLDKTRCSKAMAIYRTFPQVAVLGGMTVEQAYRQRARKKPKPNRSVTTSPISSQNDESTGTAETPPATLLEFINRVQLEAEHWIHEAGFTAPDETPALITSLEKAMRTLEEIRQLLQPELP